MTNSASPLRILVVDEYHGLNASIIKQIAETGAAIEMLSFTEARAHAALDMLSGPVFDDNMLREPRASFAFRYQHRIARHCRLLPKRFGDKTNELESLLRFSGCDDLPRGRTPRRLLHRLDANSN